MSRKPTVDEVADYLIALAHQRGESLNNLKLQKLLYYAQAWHLGLNGEPLFDARFEAWATGPVIRSLFFRFAKSSFHDLPEPSSVPELPETTAEFLGDIASEYLPFAEWELEFMARREAPWFIARGPISPDEPSDAEISEEEVRAHYRRLAEAA